MKTIIAALAIALVSTTVQAMDGAQVLGWCLDQQQRSLATIYVSGVVDTLLEDTGGQVKACVPGKVSRAVLTDVTCEWLERTQGQEPQSAAASTMAALEDEYPCP